MQARDLPASDTWFIWETGGRSSPESCGQLGYRGIPETKVLAGVLPLTCLLRYSWAFSPSPTPNQKYILCTRKAYASQNTLPESTSRAQGQRVAVGERARTGDNQRGGRQRPGGGLTARPLATQASLTTN